jgi:hypothetical protein
MINIAKNQVLLRLPFTMGKSVINTVSLQPVSEFLTNGFVHIRKDTHRLGLKESSTKKRAKLIGIGNLRN